MCDPAKTMGVLGRSYLAMGSRTSLCQGVDKKEVSSGSSFSSESSGESQSDEEVEESEKEGRRWKRKKRRKELKKRLSECWNNVRKKVEFAENGELGISGR